MPSSKVNALEFEKYVQDDYGHLDEVDKEEMKMQYLYDNVSDDEKAEWLDRKYGKKSITDWSGYGGVGSSVEVSTCFSRMCNLAGVTVASSVHSVNALTAEQKQQLGNLKDYKVCLTAYSLDDYRNHVFLVNEGAKSCRVTFEPVGRGGTFRRVFAVTTMQEFFIGSLWLDHVFYALSGEDAGDPPQDSRPDAGFGEFLASEPLAAGSVRSSARPPPPESVVDEEASGGSANVTGAVVRTRKRAIGARNVAGVRTVIPKNYVTVGGVMFNNFEELYQDTVSRDFAQVIIEDLWNEWRLPLDQPGTMKYAEDMLLSFLLAVTASNKADYNRVYDIPLAKPVYVGGSAVSEVEADFSKLSRLLSYKYGVTRRQFARGLADDQRAFLKLEENASLLPTMATRVGCESLLAYLAFDGSTHCTNLTTREVSFTKSLEARNLFERDDDLAKGASDRLMQGFSGSVRSVAPR